MPLTALEIIRILIRDDISPFAFIDEQLINVINVGKINLSIKGIIDPETGSNKERYDQLSALIGRDILTNPYGYLYASDKETSKKFDDSQISINTKDAIWEYQRLLAGGDGITLYNFAMLDHYLDERGD